MSAVNRGMKKMLWILFVFFGCKSEEKITALKDEYCEKYYEQDYKGSLKALNKLKGAVSKEELNDKKAFIYYWIYHNYYWLDKKTERKAAKVVRKIELYNDTSFYALGLGMRYYNEIGDYEKVQEYAGLITKKVDQRNEFDFLKKDALFFNTLSTQLKSIEKGALSNPGELHLDSLYSHTINFNSSLQLLTVLEHSRLSSDYIRLWNFLYQTFKSQRNSIANNDIFFDVNLYLHTELFKLSESYPIEKALGDTINQFRKELDGILKEQHNFNPLSKYQKATVFYAWSSMNIVNGKLDSLRNKCDLGDSNSCNYFKILEAETDSLVELYLKYSDD